jgi:DNA polymerase III sliding clamp (beta) subunit (PCNA family)
MKREELLKALEIVKPGLASRETIEGTTSFAFIDGNICTYNDEISIKHPVKGLKIDGAIKADEFYKLLSKLKQEEIEVTQTESEVKLICGRAKAGFTIEQEIKMPLQEIGGRHAWTEVPEKLMKALEFTMGCCASDMSRPVMTCINVRADGKIQSSDNYRISQFNVGKMPTKTFLLPSSSAQALVKYKITHIADGESWIHFKTEQDTEFSCRTFQETFPDISAWMGVEGKEITLPSAIEEVIDKAIVFCTQDQFLEQKVTVLVSDRKMQLKAKSDTSWFEEEVNMTYKGEPFQFIINPYTLKMILKETKKCSYNERCLLFQTDDWKHVVALIA